MCFEPTKTALGTSERRPGLLDQLGSAADRVLELEPCALTANGAPVAGSDGAPGEHVVAEDEIRGQVLGDTRRIRPDVATALFRVSSCSSRGSSPS